MDVVTETRDLKRAEVLPRRRREGVLVKDVAGFMLLSCRESCRVARRVAVSSRRRRSVDAVRDERETLEPASPDEKRKGKSNRSPSLLRSVLVAASPSLLPQSYTQT